LYIIFAAILALALYFLEFNIYKRRWSNDLKVNAFFKVDEVFAGEEAELTETIENCKKLPLPMIKMKLQLSKKLLFRDTDNSMVSDYFYRTDIYSIKAFQKVKRTIKFVADKRGYYDFHGIDVLGSDMFYSAEFVKSVTASSYLYVYPKVYDPKLFEPVLNRINGEVITKNNLIEDPFELKGIREYQTFDSLKNVNWKASAKQEDLMVNMHDMTAKRTIRIFLNLDDSTIYDMEDLKELCISMAVSLIISFCKRGIPVSLYANTKDYLTEEPIRLEEGSGDTHIRSANRMLARINLSKGVCSFEDTFKEDLMKDVKDSYSVIISPYMQDDFQNLLAELKESGKDFAWLYPAYRKNQFEVIEALKDRAILVPAEEALYEVSNS